jgi:hypothetical protein
MPLNVLQTPMVLSVKCEALFGFEGPKQMDAIPLGTAIVSAKRRHRNSVCLLLNGYAIGAALATAPRQVPFV